MQNRDMFYQNINQGYTNPGMFIPPSGYNVNSQIQAYGPNINPYMNQNPNLTAEQMGYYDASNEFNERINKIERQIKNLDARIQKLENSTSEVSDNVYMI
jgi:conjugal transfer/entry exclusion protein